MRQFYLYLWVEKHYRREKKTHKINCKIVIQWNSEFLYDTYYLEGNISYYLCT